MKRSDKKKAGIAIVAVPVIAAGTVAMVSAYKQGSTFTPSDAKQDFQANKVVFDNDENALDHQDGGTGDESSLLQQKNTEEEQGADLQKQADYLFENQQIQQENGTETTIGLEESQSSEQQKPAEEKPQAELQNPNSGQSQPDEVYHVTEDPNQADTTIRGNNGTIPSGNGDTPNRNNGNSENNGNNGNNGNNNTNQTPLEPSVTPTPSITPGILPQPTETPDPEPTTTPTQPVRPSGKVEDPASSKGELSDGQIAGMVTKPFTDGVVPKNDPNADGENKSVVFKQQLGTSSNTLYCGQTVSQERIYNALDTYVIGKDGTRYVWGSDSLDKYVKIDAVSFDGGTTWKNSFPVTIPSGDESINKMMIRIQYRFSEKDADWDETTINYEVQAGRVYILSEKVKEGDTVLSEDIILNEDQHPRMDRKLNLYSYAYYLLGKPGTALTSLFPGWSENGELVDWRYTVTKGRHILEPEDRVPLDSHYTVKMQNFWMSDDGKDFGLQYRNLCHLQTLTDFNENGFDKLDAASGSGWSEKHRCETLRVPKYVQAVVVDSDSGLAANYLEVPDTVIYIETVTDGLRVDKGYRVDENNAYYAATDEGMLTSKDGTQLLGIPYEMEKVSVAEDITKVNISAENKISELHLTAENAENFPIANYEYLNHCKVIVKDDLLEDFLQQNQAALVKGIGNCIAAEEEPDVTYTVKDDMIISNTGELRRVLKADRTSIQLSSEIQTIGSEAFKNAPNVVNLMLPQSGEVINLEENALSGSGLQSIRCYTMKQYHSMKKQLEEAGEDEKIALELVGVSKEGYHYASSEQDDIVTTELISAPSDVTVFDGVVTAEDGTEIQITAIGDGAFAGCESLQWVSLPESIKSIGYQAFYNCISLQGILSRSKDTISIGNQSLDGCTSLRFAGFNAMNCTAAEDYAPSIVDSYGNSCFYVPTNAEGYPDSSIYFTEDSNVTGYDMVVVGDGCRVLFGTNETQGNWLVLRSGLILSDTIELPDTTVEIFRSAFSDTFSYSGSFAVNWSASPLLWVIDASAFENSEIGGDIVLGNNYYLGENAFYGCKNITSVEAPGTSVHLDERVFGDCSSLKSVSFGNISQDTTIFSGLFGGCGELSDITFADYDAPQLGVYGNLGYQFNYDWTQEEEAEHVRIHVPEGSELNYIKAWRYLYAGYYQIWDTSAYQSMWTDIQWNNMNWDTWEFPTDEEVDRLLKEELLQKENNLRKALGVETVSEPTEFFPYRVEDGVVTIIGAPAATEYIYLDGVGLDLPDGWFPDYIGTGAFHDSANLQSVLLPDTLTGIYTDAFNGPKNNRFLLYFDSFTPLQLMGYTKEAPFRFGDDESKIEIMVPFGYENEYIAAWMYPMAGYADLDEMAADVRSELEQNGNTPTDVEVYEEVGKSLLSVENRLRQMMDLDPIADVTELEGDLPGLLAEAKEKAEQEKAEAEAKKLEEQQKPKKEENQQQNTDQGNKVNTSEDDPSNADPSNAGGSDIDGSHTDSSGADHMNSNSSSEEQNSADTDSGVSETEQNGENSDTSSDAEGEKKDSDSAADSSAITESSVSKDSGISEENSASEENGTSVESNPAGENSVSVESASDGIAVFSLEDIRDGNGWQKIEFETTAASAESPLEGKTTNEEEVLRW